MFGWEDDRARCQLFRADVASQLGDREAAQQSLEAATGWILHSGSVEHLCVYHLVRARIAKRVQDFQRAQLVVEEGLHLARRCELRLYLVELLALRAELLLCESQPVAAMLRGLARPTELRLHRNISSSGEPQKPATCSAIRFFRRRAWSKRMRLSARQGRSGSR